MIREKQLDIAISTRSIQAEGVIYSPVKSEKLLVIAHKEFPLPNKTWLSFEELKGIPIVLCDNNLNLHFNVVAKGKAINICAEHVSCGLEKKDIIGIPIGDTLLKWEIGTLINEEITISKELEALLALIAQG